MNISIGAIREKRTRIQIIFTHTLCHTDLVAGGWMWHFGAMETAPVPDILFFLQFTNLGQKERGTTTR